MSERLERRMTVAEFLEWDADGSERVELIDGVPVAMAPTTGFHQVIVSNLVHGIRSALPADRPCRVHVAAGIARSDDDLNCFIADLAVNCGPTVSLRGVADNPVLVVEVQSPAKTAKDRATKLQVYRQIGCI